MSQIEPMKLVCIESHFGVNIGVVLIHLTKSKGNEHLIQWNCIFLEMLTPEIGWYF